MIQSTPISADAPRPSLPRRLGRPLIWLAAVLAVAFAAAVGGVLYALADAPPGVVANLEDGARDLPLDGTVRIRPGGWDAQVERATLLETQLAPNGSPSIARDVPLRVEVLQQHWMPGETELALRPANGALRPDATYRLLLGGTALAPTLPWPSRAPFEREVRFSTAASPRPVLAAGTTKLKWDEPFTIRWSMPIDDVSYELSPPGDSRTWIDPADRRIAYFQVLEPQEATTYQITVAAAQGANGVVLQAPASYSVVTPERPRLLGDEERVLELGQPLGLRFNQPLERIGYEISPEVESVWKPDRADPTAGQIGFEGLEQGKTYELTVTEAVTRDGAPLAEPQKVTIVTPQPLDLVELDTGPGPRASVRTRPVLTFNRPIRDRRAAEKAITVDPGIPGRFEWLDDQEVRFIPNRTLPYDTRITVRVEAGPDGARSVHGGYVEEPISWSFRTELDKIIEVDIGDQRMTLIQAGQVVRTFAVATGVPGADTPLGEFYVQYKMPRARFRGTNPGGRSYDIPDVNWVLAFQGDYTIHGAYWRSAFGTPGSNGCVSLTDPEAKILYDWAPEGTLVRIHM